MNQPCSSLPFLGKFLLRKRSTPEEVVEGEDDKVEEESSGKEEEKEKEKEQVGPSKKRPREYLQRRRSIREKTPQERSSPSRGHLHQEKHKDQESK